jgi:AcrR family transcriptional regulator
MTANLSGRTRKQQILDVALDQAERVGYQNITRAGIARALQVSPALVNTYFGTVGDLKRDVMKAAIRDERLPIIAQGIVLKDRHAMKAPDALRARALASPHS